jgi:putative hemolysin
MSIPFCLLVMLILVVEGFFSGSELALLSADRIQLRKLSKAGDGGASLALRLLDTPERILSTTLVMTSSCVMAISVLLTLEFRQLYDGHGEVYAVIAGSALVIIFGELIPKFIYRKHAATLAPRVAAPIFLTQRLLSPVLRLTTIYTSQISRVMEPIERLWSGKRNVKDELSGLLTVDSNDTQIKNTEKRLIRKILKFRDKIAKDGLVPLVQVDAIEKTATLREAFEVYQQKKHSRLPVYDERIDNIVGTLELTHVIRVTDLKQTVARHMKPPSYVAESQKLEDILHEMIAKDSQMSIVVDEYGGAVGILTREDIFEQIVGDIQDEDDPEKSSIRVLSPNKWVVRAKATIVELNEQSLIELPEGDYDTVGGFLLRQFSRIPEVGDELYFDTRAGQILFVIREGSSRRIESVTIERIIAEP